MLGFPAETKTLAQVLSGIWRQVCGFPASPALLLKNYFVAGLGRKIRHFSGSRRNLRLPQRLFKIYRGNRDEVNAANFRRFKFCRVYFGLLRPAQTNCLWISEDA